MQQLGDNTNNVRNVIELCEAGAEVWVYRRNEQNRGTLRICNGPLLHDLLTWLFERLGLRWQSFLSMYTVSVGKECINNSSTLGYTVQKSYGFVFAL